MTQVFTPRPLYDRNFLLWTEDTCIRTNQAPKERGDAERRLL